MRSKEKLSRDDSTLWIGAFRYYLGRQTYAVSMFTEMLIARWSELTPTVQNLIRRELEEAIQRDQEEERQSLQYVRTLGHACDRQHWYAVADLWRKANPTT